MGSDNFAYAGKKRLPYLLHGVTDEFLDFRKRLSDSEFNQKQMAMLQLRLDLLDSFLRGRGGDISSFFKPGRLVIVDLSDPFVDCEAYPDFCSYWTLTRHSEHCRDVI
jgi:hypothetical protein